MSDRQSLLQSLVESALRAAADPSVTEVRRSWDWFDPGGSVQPIMPILVVSITNDRPILIGQELHTAVCTVGIVVDWSPGIRQALDAIRTSVRAAMAALPGCAAGGLSIDGIREDTCGEPSVVDPDGDTVMEQDLAYTVWFEAPVTAPAVIDPEIHLAARDPETGCLYTTTSGADPRRITRWSRGGSLVSYAHGAWADRASLAYSAPVPPVSGTPPPEIPADPSNNLT